MLAIGTAARSGTIVCPAAEGDGSISIAAITSKRKKEEINII